MTSYSNSMASYPFQPFALQKHVLAVSGAQTNTLHTWIQNQLLMTQQFTSSIAGFQLFDFGFVFAAFLMQRLREGGIELAVAQKLAELVQSGFSEEVEQVEADGSITTRPGPFWPDWYVRSIRFRSDWDFMTRKGLASEFADLSGPAATEKLLKDIGPCTIVPILDEAPAVLEKLFEAIRNDTNTRNRKIVREELGEDYWKQYIAPEKEGNRAPAKRFA